jgi:ribulose-bisphosphate carboxylase small chain
MLTKKTKTKITQGAFSFIPPLTDAQIVSQIKYGFEKGIAWAIEYTDDPHPRNTYWDMWGPPMFFAESPEVVAEEIKRAKEGCSGLYVKLVGFDASRGIESSVMSFMLSRPRTEISFSLARQERNGRSLGYTLIP